MKRSALLASAFAAMLATGPAGAVEWVKVQDPHGFEVKLLRGWSPRVTMNGAVVFSPEAETLKGPQAYVWTLHMKKPQPASEVAAGLVKSLKGVLPGMTAEGPHQLKGKMADSCSMRGKFTGLGGRWSYVFVVSTKGKVALATGFAAPEAQCKALKPIFTRILASYRLRKALRDEKRIAPPPEKWVKWTDPREGAFSLMVPKNWKVQAKASGTLRPYIDASFWFAAKKDGKDSTAIYMQEPAPPLYVEPNRALLVAGFREGAAYNPSGGVTANMYVMRYLGAAGFARKLYLPQLKKSYPDATLGSVLKRPDLCRGLPTNRWMPRTYDGAEARVSGTIKGTKVVGRAYVVTVRQSLPGSAMGLWTASLGTVCAPPAEFHQAHDIYWQIKDSFRISPRWAIRESRAVIKRSKIMAKANDEIADMIHKSHESRSKALDEINRKWSSYIRGTVDLRDPATGKVHYGVPSGSNYYWKVGSDAIIGTETHTRPTIDAGDLQNIDDLRRG